MKTAKLSLMARMKMKKADPKKKPMTVEGAAARPRLDRPGRMKRAEGGIVEDYIKPGLPTALPSAIAGLARKYLPTRRDPEMEKHIKDVLSSAPAGLAGNAMAKGVSSKAVSGEEDRKAGGRVKK